MKEQFEAFLKEIDGGKMKSTVNALQSIEEKQTFTAYRKAAEFVYQQMKAAGLPNVEFIEQPADGKTVFQDKVMPIGWDATVGRLSLVNPPTGAANLSVCVKGTAQSAILADYNVHPFHLVKGSTATPPEGIITTVVSEQQFLAGQDIRGCLVMLDPLTRPGAANLKAILDEGGLGFISDYLVGRYGKPDAVQWVNGCTEDSNWHITAEMRPFIGFSVTPRTGDYIRKNAGGLKVKVECDGHRYPTTVPAVTALIPGRQKKELWILAHLYEPLQDDDSCGVSAGIEIARLIQAQGTPEYSLRIIFAMELYGYACYASSRGPNMKNEVIGGVNIDTIQAVKGYAMMLHPAGPGVPYIGNALLHKAYEECKDSLPLKLESEEYMDDMFLGDTTNGLPTVWLLGDNGGCWHNSIQCGPDFIDAEVLRKNTAFAAAYIAAILNYTGPAPQPQVYPALPHAPSPWRDYAEKIVLDRKAIGFPFAMAAIPKDERTGVPGCGIYDTFSNVLTHLDGKNTLAHAIELGEAERGALLPENAIKSYVNCLNVLADYDYLKVLSRPELTQADILAALSKLGITKDDTLLVHASTSNCGYLQGGAATIIDTIRQITGTALFTTFTRPYVYLGGVNRNWTFRTYDPQNINAIWTGNVSKTVLRKFPKAIRSRHITHSWAGFGPNAHRCLDAHAPTEAPASANSPMAKALECGGKVLFFGTGLGCNTFLHFLEDQCDLPFLETAVCKMKNAQGNPEIVTVPKHLPGHREFYADKEGTGKFYSKARERGLEIKEVPFGISKLYLIDLKQLYTIGMQLVKEDPRIFLCDNPQCLFCQKY